MYLIDTQNKKATALEKKSFSELKLSERYDLQEWISGNPLILGEKLLIIQKEFDGFSDTNERLDLLALDENGKLVVIENKLDDSGRNVVWQALKYVSYCATLTKTEICQIYQRYLGASGSAEEKLLEFYNIEDYDSLVLNASNSDQRIILVAANFRKEVTSTVLWLEGHNIEIKCIKVTPYLDGDKLYLDTEQILPMQDVGDYQIRRIAKERDEVASGKEEALRHKLRREFWVTALPVLREKTAIFNNTSPTKDSWLTGASGRSGISYNPVIRMGDVRAEIYIDFGDKERNKQVFHCLLERKGEIEAQFGSALIWQELPERRASRIYTQYDISGLADKAQWQSAIAFLAHSIAELLRVFRQPIDAALNE
jgi:Predicted nuclease of the RecB family